jgi:hypothetical protein
MTQSDIEVNKTKHFAMLYELLKSTMRQCESRDFKSLEFDQFLITQKLGNLLVRKFSTVGNV